MQLLGLRTPRMPSQFLTLREGRRYPSPDRPLLRCHQVSRADPARKVQSFGKIKVYLAAFGSMDSKEVGCRVRRTHQPEVGFGRPKSRVGFAWRRRSDCGLILI